MHRQTTITVPTDGRGTFDITQDVAAFVSESGIRTGLCNVFIRHTSASLMICENADADVMRDLETWFASTVPDGDPMFRHTAEGPDDMPAHVRSVLTQPALQIPVMQGRLALGTWQGVYLYEHRIAPHRRSLVLTLSGD